MRVHATRAGIGPEAAALCTTYITACAELVKDFIYFGTAGWSAQTGGILNAPSSCAAANGPTTRTREASQATCAHPHGAQLLRQCQWQRACAHLKDCKAGLGHGMARCMHSPQCPVCPEPGLNMPLAPA